jgi:hypothetical protein
MARNAPIATGGGATGWTYFLFRTITPSEMLAKQPLVVLSITDVKGKVWPIEQRLSQGGMPKEYPPDLQRKLGK